MTSVQRFDPHVLVRLLALPILLIGVLCAHQSASAESLPPGYAERPNFITQYEIAPILVEDDLSKIKVTVKFRNDGDGRVLFRLPDSFGAANDYWELVDNLSVEGAIHSLLGDGVLVLTSKPGNPIIISYEVRAGYSFPQALDGDLPDAGPMIFPAWFHAVGEMIIPTIDGLEEKRADLRWVGWPGSWDHMSSADEIDALLSTMSTVRKSNFLAGAELTIMEQSIEGGTLRVGMVNIPPENVDKVMETTRETIAAQGELFQSDGFPYTVAYVGLPTDYDLPLSRGLGRKHGYSIFTSGPFFRPGLQYGLANAHTQTWLPDKLGRMPGNPDDIHWFTEGMLEYFTLQTLTRSGLWNRRQYVGRLNQVLNRYGRSRFVGVSNARLVDGIGNDLEKTFQSKDRGFLFAVATDRLLREQEGNLDVVIYRMMADWKRTPPRDQPAVIESFIEESRQSGIHIQSSIHRHIDLGIPILLQADIFGECAKIVTEKITPRDSETGRHARWRQRVILLSDDKAVPCNIGH